MGFDECYQLGYIQKTHGLKGAVSLFIDADFPENYKSLESILLNMQGVLVPFFIDSLSLSGNHAITRLIDCDTVEEAKALVGCEAWLPLSSLPELEEHQYYYHELIGFVLYNEDQLIGKVADIYQMPQTNLIAVEYGGHEVLVPLQDDIVQKVDKKNQRIDTVLPEGLLEIYVEPKEK